MRGSEEKVERNKANDGGLVETGGVQDPPGRPGTWWFALRVCCWDC